MTATELELDTSETGSATRTWWRRLPVLLVLGGVLVLLGQYFLGLVAVVLLVTDPTRPRPVRAGGALLIAWWMTVWTFDSTPALLGAGLLGAAAVWFAVAARRAHGRPRVGSAALAVAAGALGVLNLVPYGLRAPAYDRHEAEQLAIAARAAGSVRTLSARDLPRYGLAALGGQHEKPVAATTVQTIGSRFRFTQTPIWYVLLFEPNPDVATTGDGEPCFRRSETLVVDGMSGAVTRLGFRDALAVDEGCLRLKIGTRADLRPLP